MEVILLKHLIVILLASLLIACSSLPDNTTPDNFVLEKNVNSKLTQEIKQQREKLGLTEKDTLMVLLPDGVDAFVARISLVKAAQQSIDLQYYQYHSSLSGTLLTAALWQAAERGVRVRLLVDDMDLAGKDVNIAKLNSHPNFEIRIFNPFLRNKSRTSQFVTGLGSVTRRMHNKSFTVDNSISILGGRNIGDQYFGAHQDVAFGDLDIAFSGAVVQEVENAFDLYWNSEVTYGINLLTDYQPKASDLADIKTYLSNYIEQHKDSQYAKALRANNFLELIRNKQVTEYKGNAEILYDSPLKVVTSRDKEEYHLVPKLRPYINKAEKEIVIVSPYFVPGKEGVALFKQAVDKGIKIKILTNSMKSNDVTIVHSGYSKYRKDLLEMGIELYEVDSREIDKWVDADEKMRSSEASKISLHAKYFIIDRKVTFIGSLNLDPRSRHENTEIGVIAESEKMGQDIVKDFNDNVEKIAFKLSLQDGDIVWTKNDTKQTFFEEPYSSWWDRFKNGFMQLLPVESQL